MKQFIVNWNGASFVLSSAWEDSTCLNLHTDASGTLHTDAPGYGGFFNGKWFQGKWEPQQQLGQHEISIAWQELFAIVVACHIWGGNLFNTSESSLIVTTNLLLTSLTPSDHEFPG